MIRYVTLIIDFSRASLRQDMRPSRAVVIKELVCQLLNDFQDQNPMSKISVIATMKEQAIMLCDFNDTKEHSLKQVMKIDDFEGSPSYQNALDLALYQIDQSVPEYGRKEILIINSSVSICDKENIFKTIH